MKVPITVEKVVYVDRIVEKVSKDYHTEKDSDDNQEELTCSSINKTYQSKKEVYNSNNYPSEHDKKRGGQQPESGYKQELRKQAYDPVGGPVKRRDRDGHKHYVKKDSNY